MSFSTPVQPGYPWFNTDIITMLHQKKKKKVHNEVGLQRLWKININMFKLMNKQKIFKFILCRVAFPQAFGEFLWVEDHLSLSLCLSWMWNHKWLTIMCGSSREPRGVPGPSPSLSTSSQSTHWKSGFGEFNWNVDVHFFFFFLLQTQCRESPARGRTFGGAERLSYCALWVRSHLSPLLDKKERFGQTWGHFEAVWH